MDAIEDPTLAELGEAIERALSVFTTMLHKIMSGRVTWANLQDELTEDEQKLFLAFLNIGRRHS